MNADETGGRDERPAEDDATRPLQPYGSPEPDEQDDRTEVRPAPGAETPGSQDIQGSHGSQDHDGATAFVRSPGSSEPAGGHSAPGGGPAEIGEPTSVRPREGYVPTHAGEPAGATHQPQQDPWQQPPGHAAWAALPPVGQAASQPFAAPQGAGGPPEGRSTAPRARTPRWLIPLVALVALLFGLGGGVLGSVIYQETGDDTARGPSSSLEGLGVATTAPLDEDNTSVEAVAAQLLPSTVQIFATGGDEDATGSGFVFDEQGHIITNNHVIAGAADGGTVEVQSTDGQRFEVEVVGRSPVYDVAVLQADEAQDLEAVAFGAADDLVVGQGVVAIGSPLGLAATVTHGIVSAKNRPVTTGSSNDDASYINAVQTDAAINPGNSGGPLVNLTGQVVGVNSAIATTGGVAGSGGSIGVGFAIPSEQVLRTAAQIIETGEATYPVIGAQVQVGGEETGQGALVEEVNPDSPAARAGIEDGDVVTAVGDLRVGTGEELIVALRSLAPGDAVTLTVLRDGDEFEADVTLGEQTG
ncbi:trypsin-like peptidase domain-containing protein [Nocardioides zeae]|uniref:Trypsin-like peptidase domain-containing protein n=1 Tax=Nocardioides imazamoxiresistens TaxID=3231893 RepID=A0ABU3PXS3_9ACTN|nr:trypsin-like peptidase domain-containing protein [Nocardioides zeae]MDT9594035.1 trypsin-like peptidase domain-containing protein [Nocardioides zeae]